MEEGVEVDELSYYSKEKIIYNKVKSTMPFLSHKQIIFLLDCYDLIPLFISLAALFFIVRFKIDVIMSGMTTTSFRIGATTPEENATRLEGAPRILFEKLPSAEAEVKRLSQEVEDCKEGLRKPFPKEAEFQEKTLRFNEVNLLIEEQNKQEDQLVTKDLEAKQAEEVAR